MRYKFLGLYVSFYGIYVAWWHTMVASDKATISVKASITVSSLFVVSESHTADELCSSVSAPSAQYHAHRDVDRNAANSEGTANQCSLCHAGNHTIGNATSKSHSSSYYRNNGNCDHRHLLISHNDHEQPSAATRPSNVTLSAANNIEGIVVKHIGNFQFRFWTQSRWAPPYGVIIYCCWVLNVALRHATIVLFESWTSPYGSKKIQLPIVSDAMRREFRRHFYWLFVYWWWCHCDENLFQPVEKFLTISAE